MRNFNWLLTLIFMLPALSYAASGDSLSQYENMINQASNKPVTNGTQQGGQKINPAIASGQAALIPAPAQTIAPAQNTVTAPPVIENYSSNTANPNDQNQTTKQPTAPAGTPNIFITPGGNSSNKQGGSVIHY